MNRTSDTRFHLALAGIWIGGAVCICLSIAVASGEKQALARRRGLDYKERADLLAQQERLRTEIDWLGSRPSLEQAVVRLGLPIAPPQRVASR